MLFLITGPSLLQSHTFRGRCREPSVGRINNESCNRESMGIKSPGANSSDVTRARKYRQSYAVFLLLPGIFPKAMKAHRVQQRVDCRPPSGSIFPVWLGRNKAFNRFTQLRFIDYPISISYCQPPIALNCHKTRLNVTSDALYVFVAFERLSTLVSCFRQTTLTTKQINCTY